MKFQQKTAVKFYSYENSEDGRRPRLISSHFGNVSQSVFYCDWIGSYGNRVEADEAVGVSDTATVRMMFNPAVYHAFCSDVIIAKNANNIINTDGNIDYENPAVYVRYGSINLLWNDNLMEFRVRRIKLND